MWSFGQNLEDTGGGYRQANNAASVAHITNQTPPFLTAVCLPESVEDPQQRRLAGARVAHHQKMCSLADLHTQILHQQLVRVRRFVRKMVQDEGGVRGARVDVEVTAWRNQIIKKINTWKIKSFVTSICPVLLIQLY